MFSELLRCVQVYRRFRGRYPDDGGSKPRSKCAGLPLVTRSETRLQILRMLEAGHT